MLVLLAVSLSGCVWLSTREVQDWLHRATCDGGATEPGAEGCVPYYGDDDGDGFGGDRSQCRCAANEAYAVTIPGDCDDEHADVHPGLPEVCDAAGVDEDCDSTTPNGDVPYYADTDGDGYGSSLSQNLCAPQGDYRARVSGDCDDGAPDVNPDQAELCDGIDNDCLASTDETSMDSALVTVVGGATVQGDLQGAIDGAAEGATLNVCPGVYPGVVVTRGITLVGVWGAEDTLVDAGGVGTALFVSGGSDVVLSGLTLRGGTGTELSPGYAIGGGVLVQSGAALDGTALVITGNRVEGDGAAVFASGPVVLRDSVIVDNAATDSGGAVYSQGGSLQILDSDVFYNQANTGAGLFMDGGTMDLTGSRVAGNFGEFGGGLAVSAGTTVTGGTLTSNSASEAGAGVYLDARGELLILDHVSLNDNVCRTDAGGGVGVKAGTLQSIGSDWVDPDAGSCSHGNYPNDVYAGFVKACASDDADFTCGDTGCSEETYTECDCIR